jgi:pantetheine-phosphate adenylyltransferase
MSKVLYPGSFDPVHNGHIEIISTASRLFDDVIVAAMLNPGKANPLFTDDERTEMIKEGTSHLGNVSVVMFGGLVIDIAAELEIDLIVKGLRGVADFEAELQMAQMNRSMTGIETLFIPSTSEDSYIASKYIREISKFGGNVSHLVPAGVDRRLQERQP